MAVAPEARLVFTVGAVPLDEDGNLVGPGDRAVRARQVLSNPMPALRSAGATGDDVLKTTVYVVLESGADLVSVWAVVQGSPVAPTASTLVGVSLLGYEGQLVEIEAATR